jgi:hypothetical protein
MKSRWRGLKVLAAAVFVISVYLGGLMQRKMGFEPATLTLAR